MNVQLSTSILCQRGLTILLKYPSGLGLGEVDRLGRDLGGNDVSRHEKVHFVFEFHNRFFGPDLTIGHFDCTKIPLSKKDLFFYATSSYLLIDLHLVVEDN